MRQTALISLIRHDAKPQLVVLLTVAAHKDFAAVNLDRPAARRLGGRPCFRPRHTVPRAGPRLGVAAELRVPRIPVANRSNPLSVLSEVPLARQERCQLLLDQLQTAFGLTVVLEHPVDIFPQRPGRVQAESPLPRPVTEVVGHVDGFVAAVHRPAAGDEHLGLGLETEGFFETLLPIHQPAPSFSEAPCVAAKFLEHGRLRAFQKQTRLQLIKNVPRGLNNAGVGFEAVGSSERLEFNRAGDGLPQTFDVVALGAGSFRGLSE